MLAEGRARWFPETKIEPNILGGATHNVSTATDEWFWCRLETSEAKDIHHNLCETKFVYML